ncbi:insulinase family protein [Streptomyces sp. MMS24-I29]|uniref:M16 family metallopeptidase n=1 Tax=Streptomyces sp. MMS24-I29 TaxID=3351480 RepID=UPI003C7CA4CB
MPPATRTRTRLSRTTLPNGLTLLTDSRPARPSVGVALHYRAGFRSDPPGRPGLAHLVEHLMFLGSENLPDNAYFADLYACGGTAGGTTHQDYTDYFHSVAADDLPEALRAEADRMRAPRFTPAGIARQVATIQEEVERAHRASAFAGFPWPMLAGMLFGTPANTSDGFGSARTLDGVSVQECLDFHTAHYAPGNTVLTLSGRVGEHIAERVAEHFGGIPARALPPRPALGEPPLTADQVVTRRLPGRGPAGLAVGYRLPPAGTDLLRYLAHLLLARLLRSPGGAPVPGAVPVIDDARCGFFAPLDAADPDALVVTIRRPRGVSAEEALGVLDHRLTALEDGAVDGDALDRLVRGTVLEHHRDHDAPAARARALGRLEVLFGRGELLDDLPELLGTVTTEDLAGAAAGLRAARRAVLHVEPTEDRGATRRPGSAPGYQAGKSHAVPGRSAPTGANGPAETPRRSTAGSGTGSGPVAPPLFTAYGEAAPHPDRPGEPHVVVIRDDRAPLIELRLCLTQRDATDPVTVFALAELLAHRWAAAPGLDGDCTTSVQGVRIHLHGSLPRSARRHWATALARLIREPLRPAELLEIGPAAAARLRRGLADPAWAMDRATFRLLPGGADPASRAGIEVLAGRPMPFTGAVLVAVGDLDPDRTTADARQAFGTMALPAAPRTPAAAPVDGLLVVRRPGPSFALWCAPEIDSAVSPAARYLAVALVGGHAGARLTRNDGSAGIRAMAGRDGRFGVRRVAVTTRPGPENTEQAVARLRTGLREAGERPATAPEIAAARALCIGQAVRLDTQRALADNVVSWLLLEHPLSQLARLPAAFEATSDSEAALAARELFATPAFAGVLFRSADADRDRTGGANARHTDSPTPRSPR